MPPQYDEAFSPGTADEASINRMAVTVRKKLDADRSKWETQRAAEWEQVALAQQEVVRQKQVVREDSFKVKTDRDQLDSYRQELDHDRQVVQRDREQVAARAQELDRLEQVRLRNRTMSQAYIEDKFADLPPRAVVENLTHASNRIKSYAKKNISNALSGSTPIDHFARLDPKSIAPYILPKLHQLVSTRAKPVPEDIEFSETVVSSPAMAKALSIGGHCERLAEFLIEQDHAISRLGIGGLRQMSKMETSVVVPTYTAIAGILPQIPLPNPISGVAHPSVGFIVDVAPKIVDDCFNNQRWNTIGPLATHGIEDIRKVVLQTVLFQAQKSERVREGLVKSHTLELLDKYFQLPTPPADVVDLFTAIIPLLAERMCQDPKLVLWLLRRLNDPSPQIQTPAINAIRDCVMNDNATIKRVFIQVELLRRLNDPTTEPSVPVTRLICYIIPTLAVLHARLGRSSQITAFLEHPESSVSKACLDGCRKILQSSPECRADLLSVFLKLDFNKETTLVLVDVALPVFCQDWVSQGDFPKIAKYIGHSELRVRSPAQKAWADAVLSSPTNCEKIASSGHLRIVFDMCNSSQPDSIVTGWQVLPYMATEVYKAGVGQIRDLVNLIHHPRLEMRRAVLQSLQIIADGGTGNCEQLLLANAFNAMTMAAKKNPQDGPEFFEKILVCMSPCLSRSQDACSSLLQLLDSDVPRIAAAALNSVTTIAASTLQERLALRRAILEYIPISSDTVIAFIGKAISEWLGSDLAHSDDFKTFFELASHSNRQIQNAALLSLKQRLGYQSYQNALEKAQVAPFLRSLCSSNNPDAIAFVGAALPILALTLARNRHAGLLLQLLSLDNPVIKEGSSSAIQMIAGSPNDREFLLNEEIFERLFVGHSNLDHTTVKLAVSVIPNLAIDYVGLDRVEVLLELINHQEQPIREAVAKAVVTLSKSPKPHKDILRDALIPRLNGASPALIEVISNCLSRAMAHDLAVEKKFDTLFQLLQHEDVRVRSPVAAELRLFIQKSDEPTRVSLAAAGILRTALSPYDDLIVLLQECILPLLGPAFSQIDSGQSIVPLLSHHDIRLRTAASACLRNAIDSPHSDIQKMVKSGIISDIHPKIHEIESARDVWCHILCSPKAAPLLSNRAEIDLVFDCLSDQSESVRDASKKAINALARTSNSTRQCLYPTIINRLDDISGYNVQSLALAVSLSGADFISNGNEIKLVSTISHDNLALATSAIEAIIDIIARGGSTAHEKLMDADVFHAALQLRRHPARDKVSAKLLIAILTQLSGEILQKGQRSVSLILLFDDPNQDISQALCTSLSVGLKLVMAPDFPELLPSLLSGDRKGNPLVSKLLGALSERIVLRLIALKRVPLVVETLKVKDTAVASQFFAAVHKIALSARDDVKDELATDQTFISMLGHHLANQTTVWRLAAQVINALSTGSPARSEKIMQARIGESLASVAVYGPTNSQAPTIDALKALFLAAPDYADKLLQDSLPNLCKILEDPHRTVDVSEAVLSFLSEVTKKLTHKPVIESGILKQVSSWINPQFSMSNQKCRQFAFEILIAVSNNSDEGRKSVIEAGTLPVLLRHTRGQDIESIVNACNLLVALVRTRTYRQVAIDAGTKKVMEEITSLFHKSTLSNKADKKLAQDHAKAVLAELKSTKDDLSGSATIAPTATPTTAPTTQPTVSQPLANNTSNHRASLPSRVMSFRRSPPVVRSHSEGAPPTEFGGSPYHQGPEEGTHLPLIHARSSSYSEGAPTGFGGYQGQWEGIHSPSMHGRSATEPPNMANMWSPDSLWTVQESTQSETDANIG